MNLNTTIAVALNVEVNPESCQMRDRGVFLEGRDPSAMRSISPLPPPPHSTFLILPPTPPILLPLHRANPEPAVPDRANQEIYLGNIKLSALQRGQGLESSEGSLKNLHWTSGQGSNLSGEFRQKKKSPSAEQHLVPSLKAGEERGWTAKRSREK